MSEPRRILDGSVDFTIMYVTHDAFTRDLRRLAAACDRGTGFAPRTFAGWAMFAEQLHVHHRAEDAFLWPMLQARPLRLDEARVLDAMETEHAQIDPHLERITGAFADHDAATLTAGVRALSDALAAHLRHEENDALPLVESYLGPGGWAEVGRRMAESQGYTGGPATYLPWVLDDASDPMQNKVLALLPPPVQDLYHREWAPAYRRARWWNGTGGA